MTHEELIMKHEREITTLKAQIISQINIDEALLKLLSEDNDIAKCKAMLKMVKGDLDNIFVRLDNLEEWQDKIYKGFDDIEHAKDVAEVKQIIMNKLLEANNG